MNIIISGSETFINKNFNIYNYMKKRWSEEEIKTLKYGWTSLSKDKLKENLNERSWKSIQLKAHRLRLSGRKIIPYCPPFDRMNMYKILENNIIFLSVSIDTEGSIGIKKGGNKNTNERLCPYVSICNNNKEFIKKFKELGKLKNKIGFKEAKGNRKRTYYMSIDSMPEIYVLLINIKNYLIVKNEQAKLVLEFIELQDKNTRESITREEMKEYYPRQIEIYEKLKKLNKRGRDIY